MSILQAVVLGVVQGLTEPLPISSSGHLVALPAVLGWKEHTLQFDVALHMGTLLALVAYFARDWAAMALALVGCGPGSPEELRGRRRLALILMAACVPAAVGGVLLEEKAESAFRQPLLVASTLAAMGLVMLVVDRRYAGKRALGEVSLREGLLIGMAQMLALAPGVSRSGATITAGLMCHLSREDAARFSFLLSVPITVGAGLFSLRHLVTDGLPASEIAPFAVGFAAAAVVGYGAIAFLLDYLRRRDLSLFVYYRWVFAGVVLASVLARG